MAKARLVLGNRNYSSWSFRGWLAVRQSGLDVDEIVIPLDTPSTAAEIREHSPSGLVPVLIEGDRAVWDSLAILEDLAERFPSAGFWPGDPSARAMARSVTAEMHSGFRSLRANMPMNVRAHLPGRGRADGVFEDIARIQAIWTRSRDSFGSGGEFLFGDWSGADAAFAPVVSRFQTYGVETDGICRAYMESVIRHPWYREWAEAAAAEPWSSPKYDSV